MKENTNSTIQFSVFMPKEISHLFENTELLISPNKDGQMKIFVPIETVQNLLAKKKNIVLEDAAFGLKSKDSNVSQSYQEPLLSD